MSTNMIGVPLEGFADFSRKVAAEGAVLLKNDNQVLPLRDGDRVSIFGRIQINYYRSGTGSGGSVNVPYTTNLAGRIAQQEAISSSMKIWLTVYEQWIEENPFDDGGGGWAAEPWHQKEMPLTDELVAERPEHVGQGGSSSSAGRRARTRTTRSAPGSYLLTDEELAMLKRVTKHFEQDGRRAERFEYHRHELGGAIRSTSHPIYSIIYAWHGGMEGGNAIADVLVGDVTPSGKLTDTIAYSIDDYPSTANYGDEFKNLYQEDIYVGYRYFETFCPDKVQYEFGYWISRIRNSPSIRKKRQRWRRTASIGWRSA